MSLLQQVERMNTQHFPDLSQAGQEEIWCAGGYRRRSPVQPYCTPPGYWRKAAVRWVLAALAVGIAAMAVCGLFHSGLIRV